MTETLWYTPVFAYANIEGARTELINAIYNRSWKSDPNRLDVIEDGDFVRSLVSKGISGAHELLDALIKHGEIELKSIEI